MVSGSATCNDAEAMTVARFPRHRRHRRHRWLAEATPLVGITLVNAAGGIPGSVAFHLDPYMWAVAALFWLVGAALILTRAVTRLHRYFDEIVFVNHWLFAVLTLLVILDTPTLHGADRAGVALLVAGVSLAIGDYWLRLQLDKRRHGEH